LTETFFNVQTVAINLLAKFLSFACFKKDLIAATSYNIGRKIQAAVTLKP
jgi:hypothetical protein